MAYFEIKKRGLPGVVERKVTLGNKNYSPDEGNKSPYWANCRLKKEGEGVYGSEWECDKLEPTEVWVPDINKDKKPTDPSNCKIMGIPSPSGTMGWQVSGGRYQMVPGKRWVCKHGTVIRDVRADEKARLETACTAEGQQGTPQWVHKDEKYSPTSSYGTYSITHPGVTDGNLILQCIYSPPLSSQEMARQDWLLRQNVAQGGRNITEAEVEKYKELCTPYMSPQGVEIPRKPVWKKTSTKLGQNDKRLGVVEGQHELRCVPDVSGIMFVTDPNLTKIQQQEAMALQAQHASQEIAEEEEAMRSYLQQGEEAATPWYVRYKVPLILLGGMIAIGGGAAIVQRIVAGKKKATVVPAKNIGAPYMRQARDRWSVTIEFLFDGNWEHDDTIRSIARIFGGKDIGSSTDVESWMRDIEFHFRTRGDALQFARMAERWIKDEGAQKVKTTIHKVK